LNFSSRYAGQRESALRISTDRSICPNLFTQYSVNTRLPSYPLIMIVPSMTIWPMRLRLAALVMRTMRLVAHRANRRPPSGPAALRSAPVSTLPFPSSLPPRGTAPQPQKNPAHPDVAADR
jgi:hypothetical protein